MLIIQQIFNVGPALKSLVISLEDVSFIRGKVNRSPEVSALKSSVERAAGLSPGRCWLPFHAGRRWLWRLTDLVVSVASTSRQLLTLSE